MEKLKYKIKNDNNSSLLAEHKKLSKEYKRQVKFTIISVFFVTIIMISSAYAIFSDVTRQTSDNTLTVGKLKIDFIDTESGMGNIINLNGAYPISDANGNQTTPYMFKITNSGTLDAKYSVKILDDQDVITQDGCGNNLLPKNKIRVSVNNGTPFTLSDKEANAYIIDEGTLLRNANKTYAIRIWISDQSDNSVLGKHYHGKIVVEGENVVVNDNIVGAYIYDDVNDATKCINGEEATCRATRCFENRTANSCSQGTIIKYKVNANETKYFYVLHDDGRTMALQQRENTVKNIAWHANSNDNTSGPDTILSQLEAATTTWTNVNELTYTLGETTLYQNAFTGCTYSGGSEISGYQPTCSMNTYTSNVLGTRSARTRMITVLEATSTGCLVSKDGNQYPDIMGNSIDATNNGSCPDWMHNYLYNSTTYGGSYNDNTVNDLSLYDYGYWTSSADSSNATGIWHISNAGNLGSENASDTNFGARAVVQINK